MEKK
jgi:hypothetical protein